MLDFYLIKECTTASDQGADKSDFLGGIDYSDFEELQNKDLIEPWLDYYKDLRWTNDQVREKFEKLLKAGTASDNTSTSKILAILKTAKEKNCGIIAYCD